jgi:16S rRNA (guanine(966)-N(2))-methyltransferase RsmD
MNACIIPPNISAPQPQIGPLLNVTKKRKSPPQERRPRSAGPSPPDNEIRIIGGQFRGRRLRYHGDPIVRPMKHRVREAIFNLIGPEVARRHAVDLFAGTGALGLEALSRGAAQATLIEKHVPTARIVAENIRALGVEDRTTLLITSAFLWAKRDLLGTSCVNPSTLNPQPSTLIPSWLIFCSPPYDFFVDRQEEMLDLIGRLQEYSPAASLLIVESDDRFNLGLIGPDWDIRPYPPAMVGIWRKP